jgi:hypothetical protein
MFEVVEGGLIDLFSIASQAGVIQRASHYLKQGV